MNGYGFYEGFLLGAVAHMFVLIGTAIPACCQEIDSNGAALSLSARTSDNAVCSTTKGALKWNGREYDLEAGIQIVMDIVRKKEPGDNERVLALMTLPRARTQLRGRDCLRELKSLFEKCTTLEKNIILLCFRASSDPRGLPLFARVLETEKDMKLRFAAAGGLSDWNVRRGVAELVKLLESEEMLPPPTGMLPYVRDKAMRTFRLMNLRKGWGFPDDKESAEWPPDVEPPPDVAARLKPRPTIEEIRKWWSDNEHRFPEWKLGDPLPKIDKPDSAPDNNR